MTRRYAEDTKVEILETRQEIEALLRKTKAERIVIMDEADGATVAFMLAGRMMRTQVTMVPELPQQERKALWRGLLLVLKAKLTAIDRGISTVEREFLADVVLPDGQTVGHWIEPGLRLAYDKGEMPTHPLMLEGPRK